MLPVDKAFVLNLDRRADRWQHVQQQFAAVGQQVSRFPAIDGLSAEFQSLYWNDAAARVFKTPGALACLLSHIAILQCAKINGYKRIAVFEDDVLLHKDFQLQVARLQKLPPWRLVYLGATQVRWNDIQPSICDGFYRPQNTCGTWAMLIDATAYDQILRQYRQFSATADLSLVALFSGSHDVFVANPGLCVCDVTDSDIRSTLWPDFYRLCRWEMECYVSPRSSIGFGSDQTKCLPSSSNLDEAGESYTPGGR